LSSAFFVAQLGREEEARRPPSFHVPPYMLVSVRPTFFESSILYVRTGLYTPFLGRQTSSGIGFAKPADYRAAAK
jgi:hypothetical protein